MTSLDVSHLRIDGGELPTLGHRESTRSKVGFADKEAGRALLASLQERIADLQDALYAEDQRALLVILQGMDTAGKSGHNPTAGSAQDDFSAATGLPAVSMDHAAMPHDEDETADDLLDVLI